ncbi:MAG: hypothetical protein J6T02_00985, partial [Bacteroidales bacterium]|nr:hypothetical protein [Bacteroidales bacterium]
ITGTATRPLLEGAVDEAALRERVEALMAERSSLYEETADAIIDIDGLTTAEIADRILSIRP